MNFRGTIEDAVNAGVSVWGLIPARFWDDRWAMYPAWNRGHDIGHRVELSKVNGHIILLSRSGHAPSTGNILLQQGNQVLDLVQALGMQVAGFTTSVLHVVEWYQGQTSLSGASIAIGPTTRPWAKHEIPAAVADRKLAGDRVMNDCAVPVGPRPAKQRHH